MVRDEKVHENRVYRNTSRSNDNKFDFTEVDSYGFLKIYENTPFIANRIVKPKNLFEYVPMSNN
jgi:hypothetical protein